MLGRSISYIFKELPDEKQLERVIKERLHYSTSRFIPCLGDSFQFSVSELDCNWILEITNSRTKKREYI